MHYKRSTFNISFSGMMLACAMLFQMLERFMPLVPNLMSINLSLIFVVMTYMLTNYGYGTIVLFTRFILTPFLVPSGMGMAVDYYGAFIGLFSAALFIHMLLLSKYLKMGKAKNPIMVGLIINIIVCTIVMAILNGILFVPGYVWVYGGDFTTSGAFWEPVWGISPSSYWAIILSVYIIGNGLNYSIASFVYYNIRKAIRSRIILD